LEDCPSEADASTEELTAGTLFSASLEDWAMYSLKDLTLVSGD